MFKTVLTYIAAKKVLTCVVLAAMLVGVMAVACVAAVFAPKASADEMDPYAGKSWVLSDKTYGTFRVDVMDNGTVMIVEPSAPNVATTYDYVIGENGELIALDGNNAVLAASLMENGSLADYEGNFWAAE